MQDSKLSHNELIQALRNKYTYPFWILLEKVQDSPGFECGRVADGIAFGLYKSRGFEVHAFEAKVGRGDWLKELEDHRKAEVFAAMVDRFWIVAPGPEVVRQEELPAPWGLYYIKRVKGGYRVSCKKSAVLLHQENVRPLPREFVAAMLVRLQKNVENVEKRFARTVPVVEFQEAKKNAYNQGYLVGQQSLTGSQWEKEIVELRNSINRFEQVSGIKINQWDGGRIGEEVRSYMSIQYAIKDHGMLSRILEYARGIVRAIEDADTKLKAIKESLPEVRK